MNQRQQQLMDSLVRVRAFLDAHPLAGMVNASSARQMLDEVEQRVRACAGAQHTGRDSSRMELRRQEDLIAQLLDQFIRPIVTIERAQLEPESDVGLPVGLRVPKLPIGPTRVLAISDGAERARARDGGARDAGERTRGGARGGERGGGAA